MAKKTEIIDIPNLVITSPALYEIEVKGLDSILLNKMPDLSMPKTESKAQAKIDPVERERQTWREKAYYDEDGMVYMPGENIHECLKSASKYWGQKIPGEGNKTYTDVVDKAVICENMPFGIHKDSDGLIPFGKAVNGNPSKGKKSGAKVYKIRPLIRPWGGTFRIHVFDARLSEDVLKVILSYAGVFIGWGDWRPVFGRFDLVNLRKIG
ncbi:MAG: hypothetical protein WC454_05545 [Phycisphaerae bacterium]|jgi:hypothetical protein